MGYILRRQSPQPPPPSQSQSPSQEPTTSTSSGSQGDGHLGAIIGAVVAGALLLLISAAYIFLRHLRRNNRSPKYIPTAWLKGKWRSWRPSTEKRRPAAASHPGGDGGGDSARHGVDEIVNRHTSVRSIMTLPAYTSLPRATEQLIGREGERGGIDTVVEFPETAEEEEGRREEEMESLYLIRATRREYEVRRQAERAAREERRRLRQEARERGDTAALEELRVQSLRERTGLVSSGAHPPDSPSDASPAAAAGSAPDASTDTLTVPAAAATTGGPLVRPNTSEMIAEHNARVGLRERGRKVSSVAYAALGIARHDGSRMRSDSAASDAMPLLESAAGMGGMAGNASTTTLGNGATHHFPQYHDRNNSASSLSRFASNADGQHDLRVSEEASRSRSGSHADSSFELLPSPLRGGSIGGASSFDLTRERGGSASALSRPRFQESGPPSPVLEEEAGAGGHAPPPDYDNLSPVEGRQTLHTTSLVASSTPRPLPTEEAPPYEPRASMLLTPPSSDEGSTGQPAVPTIQITPHTPAIGHDEIAAGVVQAHTPLAAAADGGSRSS